jgi:hypothetical protein
MLKPGDSFERYTVEALLGEGGMGAVYRAHDPKLGRRVALKVISDGAAKGAEASARLQREARAAAAIDHPNAISIFDVGEHEGTPYIVMELVEGRTLRACVGNAGLSLQARVGQLTDVARALAVAHRRGLVHRDIKPENVMLREDGMVKVLDFGIARRTAREVDPHADTAGTGAASTALPTLTVEGVKMGTPVYMAPEQIRGDGLDGRADQFAWGVLAYELCAGRLPWRGADALAAMASVLTDPADRAPLALAGVPPAVQEVVLRALEKRPDDRFASMDDVVRALEAAARGEPAPAPAPRSARAGATEAQRFSTGEIKEVLGKALERQAEKQGSTGLGFDELLAVAAEVGVDPESLREASRALRAARDKPLAAPAPTGLDPAEAAKRDAWIRRRRKELHLHAGVYAIVNAGLLVLGLLLLTFTPWWIWFLPALAWGVGLAIHALVALSSNEDDWREHTEAIKWWNDRQLRRHEERMARTNRRQARRGPEVPASLERGAPRGEPREAPGRRVRAPNEPEKVRVAAADTARRRLSDAEEEAAAAEEPAAERKQRR